MAVVWGLPSIHILSTISSSFFTLKIYETMVVLQLQCLLVLFLASIMGEAQHVMQDAALMNYIDRRILSLEVCAIYIIQ